MLTRSVFATIFIALMTSQIVIFARANEVDRIAVAHVLMAAFDKPEFRLAVDPISIADDVAIAGWTQGEFGGRALLRRKNGVWSLVMCGGDALKGASALRSVGLAPEQAVRLAGLQAKDEARLDPARLQRFASFEGLLEVGAHGAHSPATTKH